MNTEPSNRAASPWHAGELTIQRSVGVDAKMDAVGRRVVRDRMPDQHRAFYPLLPFVVLGAVDDAGDAWATVRAGRPGFLQSPTPHQLTLALRREPGDPADAGMNDGDALGMLGIDLATRRRNRLNGTVRRNSERAFELAVEQSFGNCPQYISLRNFEFARDPDGAADSEAAHQPAALVEAQMQHASQLDDAARATIRAADTFFVASYVDREDGHRQVDVSHRGGKPGFVRVDDEDVLTIPDFAGNLFFNTLGNILVNAKAGLVFPDFASGDLLQLTGDAEVVLDSPEIAAFQGAERLWRFKPRKMVRRVGALPLRWKTRENAASPVSLLTGDWRQAEQRLKATSLANAWRPLRIARIVDESMTIRSYYLEPTDGAGLMPHRAGQHLFVRLPLAGETAPAMRSYTLSVAPSDGIYRISVKRDGRFSSHLHDTLQVGDVVEARGPAGDFSIDAATQRPAVLLAAGIGITPMLAMLRHLVYEGLRKRRIRPAWLIYSARSKADRAFDDELQALVDMAGGSLKVVRVLSETSGAIAGRDFEAIGRVDMPMLSEVLPFNDYDFYLCGPSGYMQGVYDGLRGLNIADSRIHAEAFGPSALHRQPDAGVAAAPARNAASDAVQVTFVRSGKQAQWVPGAGSLLELAEAQGLAPEFSCRSGTCGACRTRVVAGAVAYRETPAASVGDNEALICCSVPAEAEAGKPLHLQLDL